MTSPALRDSHLLYNCLVNPMCRFSGEQLRKLKRFVAQPTVEQERHGMAQDFPQQPAAKMPEVTSPYLLYGVAAHELRKNGVDAVAKAAQKGAPLGMRIALLVPVGDRQLDAPPSQLLLPDLRRVVVAVPYYYHARGMLDELGEHRKLVDVSRSRAKVGDHSRPADPYMHSEAVEGLLEEDVLAEGGLSPRKRRQR